MTEAKYNEEKMYTYLRGFLVGAEMDQAIQALSFARQKHKGQVRKNKTPYIIHPMQMACYAAALGIRDDAIMAGILLHDVCEDCGVPLDLLPVGEEVRQIVKYMTITPLPGEVKADTKKRYFHQMLECEGAVVVKGLDRYNNMSTMAGALDPDAILKNIRENDELLLPMLKEAKERYPELSDILYILRTNIRSVSDSLKILYSAEDLQPAYEDEDEVP